MYSRLNEYVAVTRSECSPLYVISLLVDMHPFPAHYMYLLTSNCLPLQTLPSRYGYVLRLNEVSRSPQLTPIMITENHHNNDNCNYLLQAVDIYNYIKTRKSMYIHIYGRIFITR